MYGSIVNTFSHNLKFIHHYINAGFGGGDQLTDVPLTCDKQPRKMVKKTEQKRLRKYLFLCNLRLSIRKILVKSPSDTPTVIEYKSATFSQSRKLENDLFHIPYVSKGVILAISTN